MSSTDILNLQSILDFIRSEYSGRDFIGLHEPLLDESDEEAVRACVRSTFVSSAGQHIGEFEREIEAWTGTKHAIATVNGTEALCLALLLAGVRAGDEIITQAATFAGTGNAVWRAGGRPAFVDVERSTLGMNPDALAAYLEEHAEFRGEETINASTGRRIAAVVPMHTFGHACRIAAIVDICNRYRIAVVEDAAESLGSYAHGKHTGTFGLLGILSFNGNKVITTGGGGMVLTDDDDLAARAKHLSTTARIAHCYEFVHDEPGFNMRMPNLNAALGMAQMKKLPKLIEAQRSLAAKYREFFRKAPWEFVDEPEGTQSNFWLNAVLMKDRAERDAFLEVSNSQKVMTRALWRPLHLLPMFSEDPRGDLPVTMDLYDRIVNIPSTIGGKI
ncbi:MAG: LegC family aminotransferase [Leptospiraceae bacterium]|nr:LegC family aminotransferase [Leptospiraceae bacterium]